VAEAGTAAATTRVDIVSDLQAAGVTSGPLIDLLNTTFATNAAARTALLSRCDVIVTPEVMSGATTSELLAEATTNLLASTSSQFRLNLLTQKAANGDTATFILNVSFRHSIID
jgi:hypothetical protein